MALDRPIRVGLMGFGQIGRMIYEHAARSNDVEIVVATDLGSPEILHYLLQADSDDRTRTILDGNLLSNPRFSTRMLQIDTPQEVPWDAFGVDIVIEATGKFRGRQHMEQLLRNGAQRVLLRTLPIDDVDRIIVKGVNDADASADDKMVSGGSATFNALCLLLNIVSGSFAVEYASMTSVHAYSSDQPVQDYAGSDFRRSRSAAENIIPNTHEAAQWINRVLPSFDNRVISSALNVPIQRGSLLDVNLVMQDETVTAEQINQVMRDAKNAYPGIVDVCEDPIVSSDVIDNSHSLLFDIPGTIKAGSSIIKALAWYENLGHAARLLDVARLYAQLGEDRA